MKLKNEFLVKFKSKYRSKCQCENRIETEKQYNYLKIKIESKF